jgi:hypothetical protein
VVEDQDLRKTARGASSPAKPALHIPELHGPVSRILNSVLSSSLEDIGRGRVDIDSNSYRPAGLQANPWECGSLPIVNDEGCDFFCR